MLHLESENRVTKSSKSQDSFLKREEYQDIADLLTKMRGDHEPTHTLLMQQSRASGWSLRLFQDILLVDANICKLHLFNRVQLITKKSPKF